MNVKLVGINGRYSHSSLALFYVRHQLLANCQQLSAIELMQLTINDSYYQTLINISSQEPDAVLFSAYVWNSERISRLVRDLGQALPSCDFVIGGPQAEIVGEDLSGRECTIVQGHIEHIDPAFYDDLVGKKLQPKYGPVESLQAGFPFPYFATDFLTHLKNRSIYYESSRGCPFGCTYCLSSIDKAVFHKSLELTQQELGDILAQNPKVVCFVDRTFNDIPQRTLDLWQFLVRQDVSTTFHFEISPRNFSSAMLDFLKTVPSGRFQFEIGIQSTNETTLASIQRPANIKEQLEVVAHLAVMDNIHLHVDLILGLPFETEQSFLYSFGRVFKTGAHYIQMGLLKILPETPLFHSCQEFKINYCTSPPYEIISSRWMDRSVIERLYWFGECVERFYNNRYFPSLWSYLRDRGEDIPTFFLDLLAICHERSFFERAPTQEFLTDILLELTANRKDKSLIKELLRYDWLRCGHRFFPACLQAKRDETGLADLKKELYGTLPEHREGLYSKKERSTFMRKSLFVHFSADSLKILGYRVSAETGILCFLPHRENSLYKLNRVVQIDS